MSVIKNNVRILYSTANDPQTGNDPQIESQMIPDVDRKWSCQKTRNGVSFLGFFNFLFLIYLFIYLHRINDKGRSKKEKIQHTQWFKYHFHDKSIPFSLENSSDKLRKKIKAVSFDLFPFLLKIKPSTQVTNSMPFIVFRKDHLRSTLGIIYCWGSLAVQFGDQFFGLGIICSRGSFAALFNTQHISKIFLASTALSQRVFSSDFFRSSTTWDN